MRPAPAVARHRPRRLLVGVAAACAWIVLAAAPAAGHAVLEGGSVVDGQVLPEVPDEVRLQFNEPVTTPQGGIRVYDAAGGRVDAGDAGVAPDDPSAVRVGLGGDVGDGTYVVTYRITSADGHPVSGALVFSIGEEAGATDELVAQVFSSDADRPWAVAATLARWAMYAGVLLAAGIAATTWWLRREVGEDDAPVAAVLRWTAWLALAATVLGLWLQQALVTGAGFGALVDVGGLAGSLGTWFGISAVVRLVGAGMLLWAAAGRRWAVAAAGGGLAALSLLLEGHTLTTEPAVVVWVADAVHVAAAATWAGGLVVLGLLLRRRRRADDPVGAGRLVARFSWLFTLSVVAVVAAGLALSWVEVRAMRALTSTAFGWTLVVKLVLVAPLLALGVWNNQRLVPVITARRARAAAPRPVPAGGSGEQPAGGAATGDPDAPSPVVARDRAWAQLRRVVTAELVLVAAVLAATSVLVNLQPAAQAAGVTGAFTTRTELEGVGSVDVTVDPNRVGRNEIHLYLLSETGRPTDLADDVTLTLTHPELDIGPLVREPLVAGPGHWLLAGPELSVPGTWEITIEAAVGRFEESTTTVEVTVNP